MFTLEFLVPVDSVVAGFIIYEPRFCSVCCVGKISLCFGLIGVLFLGLSGSTVFVECVSAVDCWKIARFILWQIRFFQFY